MTHQEEIDLSKRAKAGEQKARQRLIEKNLKARGLSGQEVPGDGLTL